MDTTANWLAALATLLILAVYELRLAWAQRRRPAELARSAHASLREEWFAEVSAQRGSEILAVQTLRNSLMSATMTASTAVLGLMGTVTLAAPSLHGSFAADGSLLPHLTTRLVLELTLLALLFASLVSSAMAVRYFNHLGFIGGMPVESTGRKRWAATGQAYARRAGLLYAWGLRQLLMVAPILASMLHPFAGPIAALVLVAVLSGFDRAVVRDHGRDFVSAMSA
jgi:hypothetical protein